MTYTSFLTVFLSEDGPYRVEICHRLYRNLLYSFFWVIPRRLNFMCRRFRTPCPIFVGGVSRPAYTTYEDGTDRVFLNVGT